MARATLIVASLSFIHLCLQHNVMCHDAATVLTVLTLRVGLIMLQLVHLVIQCGVLVTGLDLAIQTLETAAIILTQNQNTGRNVGTYKIGLGKFVSD